MITMPDYIGEALENAVPGETKAVHYRGGEAVVVSLDENGAYYVSHLEFEGAPNVEGAKVSTLREERYVDGLRAGLRFSELENKLPEDDWEPELPRFRDVSEIPRWDEVEDFLFS